MPQSTKEYVLDFKEQIDNMKNSDHKCRSLYTLYSAQKSELEQLRIDQKDVETNIDDPIEKREIYNIVNTKIENLEKEIKDTKTKLETYLANKNNIFKDFYRNRIGLFEGILYDTLDNSALTHCLDTYDLLEKGEINVEQGKEIGYKKFHLKQ